MTKRCNRFERITFPHSQNISQYVTWLLWLLCSSSKFNSTKTWFGVPVLEFYLQFNFFFLHVECLQVNFTIPRLKHYCWIWWYLEILAWVLFPLFPFLKCIWKLLITYIVQNVCISLHVLPIKDKIIIGTQ
jgi:hypothetical protein